MNGFTEHHRRDEIMNKKSIFCSNPAYRSNSGQVCDVWYDWASFDYKEREDDEEGLPPQILYFLNIDWNDEQNKVGTYALLENLIHHPKNYKVTNQMLYGMDIWLQQNFI